MHANTHICMYTRSVVTCSVSTAKVCTHTTTAEYVFFPQLINSEQDITSVFNESAYGSKIERLHRYVVMGTIHTHIHVYMYQAMLHRL